MKKKVAAFLLSILLCISLVPAPALAAGAVRDTSAEEALASDLKGLGLFKGVSDTDFDLGRAPSRAEALVMLIRVLGRESDALAGTWSHPFGDVASWADQYVGYAYAHGLTNGISATSFGTGNASAGMYLTFVLRALGYSDSGGADFTWDDPFTLAQTVGLLPDGVDTDSFLRADVVLVSYAALPAKLKDSQQTLAAKLIAAGAFSQADFDACYDGAALQERELGGKQIFQLCSPAVFCIEALTSNGDVYSMSSGFFIDKSGIAVTNFHVLRNAQKARAILSDGTSCEITGVLRYDEEEDYAIIRVDGSGFPVLQTGDSGALESGETIYAIGNPDGLTNSISDGIVSNPSRKDLNGMIQITAPISPGSSGGALLNVYGKVVGITAASIVNGQNLNFAVPISAVLPDEPLASYEKKHGLTSLPECAAIIEASRFESVPDPLELNYVEVEPNDTAQDAGYIENGGTVWGTLDDEPKDVYLVQCNAPGALIIALASDEEGKYVRDLSLTVKLPGDVTAVASAEPYWTDNGDYGKILTYGVPGAGVYEITVGSSELYLSKTVKVDTDYAFYYLFIPASAAAQKPDLSDFFDS